jgi:hypothetical protein
MKRQIEMPDAVVDGLRLLGRAAVLLVKGALLLALMWMMLGGLYVFFGATP